MIDSLKVGIKKDIEMLGLNLSSSTYEEVEDKYSKDITLATFDRVMISVYNRKHFKELLDVLSSDIIIDEFHEVMSIERMLFFMKVFLIIRSKQMKKTVLLSGTSNEALCSFLNASVISRDSLPEVHLSKFKLVVSNEDKSLPEDETAMFFNRVKDTQVESKLVIHSRFTEKDKERNREDLFKFYGKSPTKGSPQIYLSYLGTSSLDYSVKNFIIEICSPETLSQMLGRRNRWGNLSDGIVQITTSESLDSGYFCWYDKKLVSKWQDLLRTLDGQEFTHREFMRVYDSFIKENKKESLKFIEKLSERGREDMKGYYPKYFPKVKKSEKHPSSCQLKFRGDSFSALVYDPTNKVYQKVSIDYIQEEFKAKAKKPTYRKMFAEICKRSELEGLDSSYSHPNVVVGSEFNPVILSTDNEELNKTLATFFELRFYNEFLGVESV